MDAVALSRYTNLTDSLCRRFAPICTRVAHCGLENRTLLDITKNAGTVEHVMTHPFVAV